MILDIVLNFADRVVLDDVSNSSSFKFLFDLNGEALTIYFFN